MSSPGETMLGFSTVVQLSNGTCVILFAPKLTGLRAQFEKLTHDERFDARKACQVEIRQLAACGDFTDPLPT